VIDETIAALARLVAFDTTSHRSNLELIDWVADRLDSLHVPVERLPSPDGRKASLVARLGPCEPGGVVVCGHTDVVPVDDQPWTVDPFVLTDRGDRLLGRGTADMKGFIAAVMAALPELAARRLARPITLALTYDEELGALAAPQLAAHLTTHHPPPRCVLVGEPTSMRAVMAHKGVRVLQTEVTGRAAHSSRPDKGSSAVTAAARIVLHIDELGRELAALGVRSGLFDPPYTTVNVGTITGGQALNIIPHSATLLWEHRNVPGQDVEAILSSVRQYCEDVVVPDLRRQAPEASVVTRVLADVPALEERISPDVAALLDDIGVFGAPLGVSYGTDGSALQRAGMPVVVCGPGSMEQGHQPDEHVDREQLVRCGEVLARLAEWAAR